MDLYYIYNPFPAILNTPRKRDPITDRSNTKPGGVFLGGMENTRGMGFQQFENLDATNRERNWAQKRAWGCPGCPGSNM